MSTPIRTEKPDLQPLVLARHVRWCLVEDVVYFLDLFQGEYFALDPENSAAWLRLIDGQDWQDGILFDDLKEAINENGWFQDNVSRQHLHVPNMLWPKLFSLTPRLLAFWCLCRTSMLFRTRGFPSVYAATQKVVASLSEPENSADLEDSLGAFRAAEGLAISRLGVNDCLPRSLALCNFLYHQGHCVRHVIGIRRYPFMAHAWVEFAGRKLLESVPSGAGRRRADGSEGSDFSTIASLG